LKRRYDNHQNDIQENDTEHDSKIYSVEIKPLP
jgi:hypothetical protein